MPAEQNDEWAVARRYMSPELLAIAPGHDWSAITRHDRGVQTSPTLGAMLSQ